MSEPLDLRAADRIIETYDLDSPAVFEVLLGLRAHCRALRAALQHCHDDLIERKAQRGLLPNQIVCLERATAVLAQATDSAGA